MGIIKTIIAATLISAITFPIMLFFLSIKTGFLSYKFGKQEKALDAKVAIVTRTPFQDSLLAKQSKSFMALKEKEKRLNEKESRVENEEIRLDTLKSELEEKKGDLTKLKTELEGLIKGNEEAKEKRLKKLAQIYGEMRPEEAAAVLATMDDGLLVKILLRIPEKRKTGQILAKFPADRAGRVSKLMSSIKKI